MFPRDPGEPIVKLRRRQPAAGGEDTGGIAGLFRLLQPGQLGGITYLAVPDDGCQRATLPDSVLRTGMPRASSRALAEGATCPSTGAPSTPAEAPTSRVILSWNGSQGIPFEWGNLTTGATGQQSTLDAGDATPYNANRLNFLRGDRSNECHYRPPGVGLYRDAHQRPRRHHRFEPELGWPGELALYRHVPGQDRPEPELPREHPARPTPPSRPPARKRARMSSMPVPMMACCMASARVHTPPATSTRQHAAQ